eukprot:TRINITY_DN5343_c0_g1_i1.p1 TRINITY_DN5343_c0_g1~~TRINITY_DN5343_c0_g1_i1.p1  ORF type:complete len:401 (-),score=133.65 TRINITY_DN5343_c0_g1_i1:95-1297(-)
MIAGKIFALITEKKFPTFYFNRIQKVRWGDIEKFLLLVIIWISFCDTFVVLTEQKLPISSIFVLFVFFIFLYLFMFGLSFLIGQIKFITKDRSEALVLVFTNPSKTLALGIPLILILYKDYPYLGLFQIPLLIYQPLQLTMSGLFLNKLKSWRERDPTFSLEESMKGGTEEISCSDPEKGSTSGDDTDLENAIEMSDKESTSSENSDLEDNNNNKEEEDNNKGENNKEEVVIEFLDEDNENNNESLNDLLDEDNDETNILEDGDEYINDDTNILEDGDDDIILENSSNNQLLYDNITSNSLHKKPTLNYIIDMVDREGMNEDDIQITTSLVENVNNNIIEEEGVVDKEDNIKLVEKVYLIKKDLDNIEDNEPDDLVENPIRGDIIVNDEENIEIIEKDDY